MSTLTYTTEQLIQTVRLRARIPNVSVLGTTDDDIVRILNEQMKTTILPGVLKPLEDHFVRRYRQTITAGTMRYRVPHRAAGLRLKQLYYLDSSNERILLPRISSMEIHKYSGSGATEPAGFLFEGSNILLIPDNSSTITGTLEYVFYMRPSDLVLSSEYRVVQSVDSTTQITLSESVPITWLGGLLYDVHGTTSGAELKCWGRAMDSIDGTVITFASAIDGSVYGDTPVAVGDYFCLENTAAVPPVPVELHVPLAVSAAAAIVAPINPDLSMRLENDFGRMMAALGYVIDIRLEGPPPSLTKKNRLFGES
jgi:hypothetical protein